MTPRRHIRPPNRSDPQRLLGFVALALILLLCAAACSSSDESRPDQRPLTSPVQLSNLNGATTTTSFTLRDDTAGVTEAKFYVTTHGSVFVARVQSTPFQTLITVPPGANTIQVRHTVDDKQSRVDAAFEARATSSTAESTTAESTTAESTSQPAVPSQSTTAASTSRAVGNAGVIKVATAAQLSAALKAAKPGSTISVAAGQYRNDGGDRWTLANSGTKAQPITLQGGRDAILDSDSPKGDYGLWITGSYWRVTGLSVRNATKGIVLDGSMGTVLDDVAVYDTGEEGVHFRSCSAYNVLQNSFVHDTGLQKPQFGEGVYVGSANSNWSKYSCGDGRDNSEHNTIKNNRFQHIAAEGADLKEGTDSGLLTGNTFSDTGYSGENSADSAVDAKGNNWLITANTASDPKGADTDAFQSHQVYPGYGTGNVFGGNIVQGSWPGYGFGLYPRADNVVRCDNRASGARQGLVGDSGKPITCGA